jgi:hypothetical protein
LWFFDEVELDKGGRIIRKIYSEFEWQPCNLLCSELAKTDKLRRSLAHQYTIIRVGLFQVPATTPHCCIAYTLESSQTQPYRSDRCGDRLSGSYIQASEQTTLPFRALKSPVAAETFTRCMVGREHQCGV